MFLEMSNGVTVRFHFSNILFINLASISSTFFSSIPLPLQQHNSIPFNNPESPLSFRHILFINPASISETFVLSIPVPNFHLGNI